MAYTCWRTEDLDSVLNLEALVGKEELFFATHLPIERLRVKKGSSAVAGRDSIGQDVLFDALCTPRDHMFCVVEGVAGCGKSHLIRWLYVQWKRRGPQSDVLLLLPRSGRNPGKMVQELRKSLDEYGFGALAAMLAVTSDLNKVGQRLDLINKLGLYLNPDATTLPYAHADWSKAKRLSSVMEATPVREQWQAPERIISEHTTAELPKITLEELWELVHLALKASTIPPVTRAALEKIRREKESEGREESNKLLETVNARLRPALRSALGLNDAAISQVFVELRAQLHKDGRRLVILQEDITAAQGIDDTLLDLFVSPGDIGSVPGCPLVAVCGITPRYERLYFNQTYGTRTTLHLDMSESGAGSGVVATPDLRRRFVGRYMNGVRWSAEELRQRWQGEGSPPNACDDCVEQQHCHATFDTGDNYGLYPFTPHAIERAFENLHDQAGQDVAQTPRNILLGLLQPSLKLKKQVEESRFPGVEIRTDRLKSELFQLRPQVANHLKTGFAGDVRLENLIALWGNGGETLVTVDGPERAYAGVRKNIYAHFGLPWPGDGSAPPPPGPKPPPVPGVGGKKPDESVDPKEREYRLRSRELAAWKAGQVIGSANIWEGWIWEILKPINWADRDIPEWAGRWLTRERIKLGMGASTFLVIPHEPWVTEGLEALIEFEFRSQPHFHRFGVAYLRLASRVRELAVAYVQGRLRHLTDLHGKPWNPIRAALECLLIYGWVNGFLTPEDALERQWQFVLDYPVRTADTNGREDKWRELAGGDLPLLQRAHATLENWIALRQGSGPRSMENGFLGISILVNFCSTLQLGPFPDHNKLGNQNDLLSIEQAQKFAETRWPGLVESERERLKELFKSILQYLELNTLKEACSVVDQALKDGFQIAHVAAHEHQRWSELYAEVSAETWWGSGAFEKDLDDWNGTQPDQPASVLAKCIRVPAARYDKVARLLRFGDDAVYAIKEKIDQILKVGGGDPTEISREIRTAGAKLVSHAAGLGLEPSK